MVGLCLQHHKVEVVRIFFTYDQQQQIVSELAVSDRPFQFELPHLLGLLNVVDFHLFLVAPLENVPIFVDHQNLPQVGQNE